MHRFFAPVAIDTVNESSYPVFVQQLRAAEVDRVVLCCVGEVASESGTLYDAPERLARYIRQFSRDGFEVGVWLDSLGHGVVLNHAKAAEMLPFSPIVGLNGKSTPHAICPLDPQFRAHYAKALQIVAAMHPDLIMLDDDFRLNTRGNVYDIGCFFDIAGFNTLLQNQVKAGQNTFKSALDSVMTKAEAEIADITAKFAD